MIDIDVDFIEKILRKHEKDESIQITNVLSSPACKKGENFMSTVSRVHIEGRRNGINNIFGDYKISLIIKRPLESEAMQTTFNSTEIFINEVIAYNQIVPILQENYKISLPIAECLFANQEMIILEDLSSDGYEMRRNEVSMSINQILAVLQELSIVHAASIILKNHNADIINDISKQITEIYRHNNDVIIALVDKNIGVALKLLRDAPQTEEIITTTEKLENCKHLIYQRVCKLIEAKKETNVLNHGDCWRNNILFKTTRSGIKVKLIDLQTMRYTSVAADLNYFLYINLTPEERNRNLDLLLDTYLNALHRVLREHNLDYQMYSREWLEKEMTDFEVFGFMCSLWISPAFYYDTNDFPDMANIRPEELNADYQSNFILEHMTPELSDRIISLVIDFVHTYIF